MVRKSYVKLPDVASGNKKQEVEVNDDRQHIEGSRYLKKEEISSKKGGLGNDILTWL